MFGYSRQAARKSAVFEMMFWFASRMTSLDLGLLCLRYHATWQARSYGPGGQRYAAGGRGPAARPQVAEGGRDERGVGLERDALDGRVAEAPVLRGGRAAPPAADDHDPARRLRCEIPLHRGGAPTAQQADTQSDSRRSQELTSPHRLHRRSPLIEAR